MGIDKKCLLCDNRAIARDLCSSCWSKWRHGQIDHPQFGKFVKSDKGAKKLLKTLTGEKEDPPENLQPKADKKTKQVNHSKKPPTLSDATDSALFREIRQRFREVEALFIALKIIGQGDQVKKELELFTQRFV